MLDRIRTKLFTERINGKKITIGGLEEHKDDKRDFKVKDLGGWFDYKPLNRVKENNFDSIKNQGVTNTCVWQSYAASREAKEQVPLSPKSMVRYAIKNGLLRGNGFSTLREGQKVGIDFGIAEERFLNNDLEPWSSYAYGEMSDIVKTDAYSHRGKGYFSANSKYERLKTIDDGYAIHTGLTWRTAYNMSGGLRAPYILRIGAGSAVGGHAVSLIGYDLNKGLYKFRNSFGESYGDRGCFYVPIATWDKLSQQSYATIDLDENTLAAFLKSYHDKDVKTDDSPAIYKVEDGKLRPYPDALTFHVYGGSFEPPSYEVVSNKLLELLNVGEMMNVENSSNWLKIKRVWRELRWGDEKVSIETIKKLIK